MGVYDVMTLTIRRILKKLIQHIHVVVFSLFVLILLSKTIIMPFEFQGFFSCDHVTGQMWP